MMAAGFMDLVDTTVVNVAVPSIKRDLGASFTQLQWMIAAYSLAFGMGLVTGGRLGDLYGRKKLFVFGVAVFTITSAIAAFAPDAETLVTARALQGLAGAIMVPQILAFAQTQFRGEELPKALAAYGAMAGLAVIVGPVMGGVLVQGNLFGLEWRPIFLINIPIGLIALLLTAKLVPETRAERAANLDLVGVVLLSLSLFCFLFPLVQRTDLGLPKWAMPAMLVASIVLMVAFLRWQKALTARKRVPLVPLALFRARSFSAGLGASVVFWAGIGAFFTTYFVTLQVGLEQSALRAGFSLLPFSLLGMMGAGGSAKAVQKIGPRILQIGAVVLSAGTGLILVAVKMKGVDVSIWWLAPGLGVAGLGMGLVVAPLVDVILAGVPPEDAGAASGVLNASFYTAQAIGVAIIGVIFFIKMGDPTPASSIRALEVALWCELGVFLATAIAMMFLPPARPRAA
jgi:EmrB/QacA subfamily drug resistance transporter